MADTGVAATVLTATDLYLGGRHTDHNVPRNVVDLNRLTELGVTCSVGSNNILNPFTPFGDGQLLRQVNMQAIVTQRGNDDEVRALWDMTTSPPRRRLMRQKDYGIAVGAPADLVMLDAPDAGHGAADRGAGAGRLQARPAHRDPRAGAAAQAVMRGLVMTAPKGRLSDGLCPGVPVQ